MPLYTCLRLHTCQYILRICKVKLDFANYIKSNQVLKHKIVMLITKYRHVRKKQKICAVYTLNLLSDKSTNTACLASFQLLYFKKHFLHYGGQCRHCVILVLICLRSLLSPFTENMMQQFSLNCRYCSVPHTHLRTSSLKSQSFVRGNKSHDEILKWVKIS